MPELTEWLFQKSVALRIPLSVHIDLTMRCNERCIHCYRVIEQRPELTTEELKTLLADVARAGTRYLTFSAWGGFLRQDLVERVGHQWPQPLHRRRQAHALRSGAKELRTEWQDPQLSPSCATRGAASAPDGARSDLDGVPCGAAHNACYISAYGAVMPCVAMRIACGNVRDEPFAEIWHRSPDMLRVRSIRIRDLHTCSSCAASPFCSRCPGQALVETGDLYGPSPANCEHALVGAQVAGSPAIPASMLRRPPSATRTAPPPPVA